MIVPMKKVSLIIMGDKKSETLGKLRKLGILHIEAVEGSGKKLEELKERVALLESALFSISEKKNKKIKQENADVEKAISVSEEIVTLGEEKKQCTAEKIALGAELDRLADWGEIDPVEIIALAENGIDVSLYEMPKSEYDKLGESVKTLPFKKTKSSVKFLLIKSGLEGENEAVESLKSYRFEMPASSTNEIRQKTEVLNNRINGTLEYYDKRTKDLLNSVSAPAGTNFTNIITANVGEMQNQGVEFNVNAIVIQSKDFTWDIGYNITWNKSKITKLTATYNPNYPGIAAGNAPFATGTTIQYHQVGYAPSTFYLYQQVYDEHGNPIQNAVVDRNKDGEITQADQYFTGKSPMPKVFMGLNSQFRYKNWDLGFNLRANFGNYVFNGFAADHTTLAHFNNQGFISNYYKDAGKYGFTHTSENYQKTSDLYLENASFLKMDNLTLGYTFDKFITDKISGRVSFSIQNVFTITNYSGLDPECAAIDANIWPRPKTYTVGLNLNF